MQPLCSVHIKMDLDFANSGLNCETTNGSLCKVVFLVTAHFEWENIFIFRIFSMKREG